MPIDPGRALEAYLRAQAYLARRPAPGPRPESRRTPDRGDAAVDGTIAPADAERLPTARQTPASAPAHRPRGALSRLLPVHRTPTAAKSPRQA